MALRGIDFISATAFLAEIGDLSRFRMPRELMAYLGLVPSEASTGDTVKRGAITKAGHIPIQRLQIWRYKAARHLLQSASETDVHRWIVATSNTRAVISACLLGLTRRRRLIPFVSKVLHSKNAIAAIGARILHNYVRLIPLVCKQVVLGCHLKQVVTADQNLESRNFRCAMCPIIEVDWHFAKADSCAIKLVNELYTIAIARRIYHPERQFKEAVDIKNAIICGQLAKLYAQCEPGCEISEPTNKVAISSVVADATLAIARSGHKSIWPMSIEQIWQVSRIVRKIRIHCYQCFVPLAHGIKQSVLMRTSNA
jgi:hypothetical protein